MIKSNTALALSSLSWCWAQGAFGQSSPTYKELHEFGGTVTNSNRSRGPDGYHPYAAVTLDKSGNMYGTTLLGGPKTGPYGEPAGMVWEVTKNGVYRDLHDFGGWHVNGDGSVEIDGIQTTAGLLAFVCEWV